MNDVGDLADPDVAVYRAALTSSGRSVDELAETLDTTADEVEKSVARLSELGLLRRDGDQRVAGVSPMLAEATVLGAEDLELGARRAAVERRRDTIRRLVPEWTTSFTAPPGDLTVDVITDQTAMANVLMHYAGHSERELMSTAPGRLTSTRIDGRTRVANVYAARRGIKTRALYQHTALRDRTMRSYLNELAGNGADIRFAPAVPGRSLVVDRSLAVLPIPTDDLGRHGLAIVREPHVVAWVVATFEQLWAEAAPLDSVIDRQLDDTELDETRAAILRLMAEGEKDEAISRRLSISVRTCRRHIADYMAQVGATSRFQAGVIAARAGHTDSPNPL